MSGASRNVKKQIAIGRYPGHLWHGPLYLPTLRVKLGKVLLPDKSMSTSLCIIRLFRTKYSTYARWHVDQTQFWPCRPLLKIAERLVQPPGAGQSSAVFADHV